MKRVFVTSPNITDSTSFWRVIGPVGRLQKTQDDYWFDVPLSKNFDFNMHTFLNYDCLLINRPFTENHFKICLLAKRCGLKLWVDYDDDILNIPVSNHAHEIYGKANAKKWVSEIARLADFMTVSTSQLKYVFGDADKVYVAPNALNDSMFEISDVENWGRERKVIYWRGSKTHGEDLYQYKEVIEALVKKYPQHDFNFIAEVDWHIKQSLMKYDNVEFKEGKPLIEYNLALKSLRPAVNIVPLADHAFNRSKSMCSWIEATHAGAVSVGPNFEEWDRPGIINYDDPDSFFKQTKLAIENYPFFKEHLIKSRKEISENLTVDKVNTIRLEALRRYV